MTDAFLQRPEANARWRRLAWPALILVVAVVVYGMSLRPFASGLEWSEDYAQARQASAESGRPLLIEFFSPTCPYCAQMDRGTLTHPEVKELLASFERVKVNAWDAPALANRYKAYAVPAFVALDANERPIARVEGYLPPDQFAAFLQRTLERPASPRVP